LVISQDLDELFEIADRLTVIHDGHLGPVRPVPDWSREAIGLEMMGVANRQGSGHAA
jgi:simple sugar transport system ATP-binding protein